MGQFYYIFCIIPAITLPVIPNLVLLPANGPCPSLVLHSKVVTLTPGRGAEPITEYFNLSVIYQLPRSGWLAGSSVIVGLLWRTG